ncbi:DUF4124 domain-containing protein [Variovorax humicola]|uniref:DUF4124 domain-containing protein n=1 Tax=Variovorax humicola TaxID=1769758 RepID=A0ABU8W1C2_9BURK
MKLYSASLVAVMAALAAAPAMALVHRCTDADGKVSFSDTVCNGARAEKSFGAVPSARGWKEESYRPAASGTRQEVTPVSTQASPPAARVRAIKTAPQ